MMYGYGGMSGWGYALMTIGMVAFWGLVIVGVVFLVRALARGDHDRQPPAVPPSVPPSAPPNRPEELLAERYARGEIDEEEYRRRLEVLRTSALTRP